MANKYSKNQVDLKKLDPERLEYLYRSDIREKVKDEIVKWHKKQIKWVMVIASIFVTIFSFVGVPMIVEFVVGDKVKAQIESEMKPARHAFTQALENAIKAKLQADEVGIKVREVKDQADEAIKIAQDTTDQAEKAIKKAKEATAQVDVVIEKIAIVNNEIANTKDSIQELQVAAEVVQGLKNAEDIVGNITSELTKHVLPEIVKSELNPYLSKLDIISYNKDAISNLTDYIDDRSHRIELRLVKIEHDVGLPVPFTLDSPACLTKFGKEILRTSGMEAMLARYKTKLMEKVKAENLPASPSAYEVERIAIKVINNYPDFDKSDAKLIEDYMYNHPMGMMFDIWDIAGIHFRNMLLEDLGMPVPAGIRE